jgi:hypothetical protein
LKILKKLIIFLKYPDIFTGGKMDKSVLYESEKINSGTENFSRHSIKIIENVFNLAKKGTGKNFGFLTIENFQFEPCIEKTSVILIDCVGCNEINKKYKTVFEYLLKNSLFEDLKLKKFLIFPEVDITKEFSFIKEKTDLKKINLLVLPLSIDRTLFWAGRFFFI